MSKDNDFFNLNSDSEAEDDKSSNSKWDWDKTENCQLYFQNTSNESKKLESKTNKISNKRLLVENYDESDEDSGSSNNNEPANKLLKSELDGYENKNNKNFQLIAHQDCVNRVYWSKKIENKNLLLSSSMDSTIIIWDISKKSPANVIQKISKLHTKSVRNAIWSNYETEIASISYDQTCGLSDVETGKELNKLSCPNILTSITNNPLNDNIYLIGSTNCIYAWDSRTSKICKTYKSKMGQVQDLLFLNDNEFISSGDVVFRESAEYALMVWDYETTGILSNQIYHEKFVCTCLKKHPNWNLFFAQTHGNYIGEFSSRNPYKMNKYKRFEGHESQGYNIGFDVHKNGNLLISGSIDGNAVIYNLSTSKIIKKFNVFKKQTVIQPCMDAKFHPHIKNRIAFSCWNGTITIHDDWQEL